MTKISKYLKLIFLVAISSTLFSCKSNGVVGTYYYYVNDQKVDKLVLKVNNVFEFVFLGNEQYANVHDKNVSGTWRNAVFGTNTREASIIVLKYFSEESQKEITINYDLNYDNKTLTERSDYFGYGEARVFR